MHPSPAEPLFSIIIPAYNEAEGIAAVLVGLTAEPRLSSAEILVIDDGSRDGTAAIVRQFPAIRLIQHPQNKGYGSAIRSGAKASHGKYLLWFDSDGQHRIEDLLAVMDKLSAEDLDYVIGVRSAGSHIDGDRRLGKWLLRQAVNFASGQPLPDFNSGLRGFRREVLLGYLHLLPRGFGASTLTTLLMNEGGHTGGTVPIQTRARTGKSSVRQLRDGFRTLGIILHIVLLFKPLKFFGLLGLLLILVGLVYGFIKASINQLGFPVFASLLIILGVQAFFFGLLADQVGALRRERFN